MSIINYFIQKIQNKSDDLPYDLLHMLDNIALPIIISDRQGIVVFSNDNACKLFDYVLNDFVGMNVKQLCPPDVAKNHDKYINRYNHSPNKNIPDSGKKVHAIDKHGKKIPCLLRISTIILHNNDYIMATLVEERELESAYELAQKELHKCNKIKANMMLSDDILYKIMPPHVVHNLKQGRTNIGEECPNIVILFSDIVGFTDMSKEMDPRDLMLMLNNLYTEFDAVSELLGIYKVETIGDAYMATTGMSFQEQTSLHESAATMAHMAHSMLDVADSFEGKYGIKLKIRIGIHCGDVVAGIVGLKMPRYCLFGDTVNTASRMESTSIAGHCQVSEPVYNILKGNFNFQDRGEIEIKGKGLQHTYFLGETTYYHSAIVSKFKDLSPSNESLFNKSSPTNNKSFVNILANLSTVSQNPSKKNSSLLNSTLSLGSTGSLRSNGSNGSIGSSGSVESIDVSNNNMKMNFIPSTVISYSPQEEHSLVDDISKSKKYKHYFKSMFHRNNPNSARKKNELSYLDKISDSSNEDSIVSSPSPEKLNKRPMYTRMFSLNSNSKVHCS